MSRYEPRLGAALFVVALTTSPLVAHDDDPKMFAGPAYNGPGWRPAPPVGMQTSNAGTFTSSGVTLQSWLSLSDLGGGASAGNDCWGYVSPSGREYAIIGVSNATKFVEITNPTNPQVVGSIAGPSGTWRDIKVFGDYAYSVCETNCNGIQVIDMTNIDNGTVSLAGTINGAGTGQTHNVAIDEDSGYLYRTGGPNNGLRIYDLGANPVNPPFVGQWQDKYVHDAQIVTYTTGQYAGREIAFCCSGFNGGFTQTGLSIVDVTNKSNPFVLDTVFYPNPAYSHQGWLTDDRQYFLLGDELDENGTFPSTTHVIDVSDLNNAFVADSFTNGNQSITHNLYTKGNLVYEANYRSGLRIFDITNPLSATEVAFFDTYPGSDSDTFNGLWSCYPYFPSGTIIGSDRDRGLFVWTLELVSISLPNGPPATLDTNGAIVDVTITEGQPGTLQAGSEMLFYDAGNGFVSTPLVDNGGGDYDAIFPALPCGTPVDWYIQVQTTSNTIITSPTGAPAQSYGSVAADGSLTLQTHDMETPSGWVGGAPGDTATTGVWERVDPIGTAAQPEDDHTNPGTQCWVTGQQPTNSTSIGANDVDGGYTTLLTPIVDLTGTTDARISYWRWYSNDEGGSANADIFEIDISNNGGTTWTSVEVVGPSGPETSGGWFFHDFRVADFVTPTANVQMRFVASDLGGGSIVEAAVDDFDVTDIDCQSGGLGTNYCGPAVLNSSGNAATVSAAGSAVVADNDVTLTASGMAANQFGYFLTSQTQAFFTPPGSMGNLCLGGTIARFNAQVQNTGAAGTFMLAVDLTNIPLAPPQMVMAGETWNFTAWFRDFVVQPTSNFTDGLSILFQ